MSRSRTGDRLPAAIRPGAEEIIRLIDSLCAEHLDAEARRRGLIPDLGSGRE